MTGSLEINHHSKTREANAPFYVETFPALGPVTVIVWLSRTHDDDVGHALEGGLFDLGDEVVVDAQLLQALGHVGGHVLEGVPGQVETLQLGERAEGLVVNGADLVVHQDQSLDVWKGQE